MAIDWGMVVLITFLVIGMLTLKFRLGGGLSDVTATLSVIDLDPILRAILSVAVLGASLWVILSGGYQDATEKWAFGAIGTVLGYWFKR